MPGLNVIFMGTPDFATPALQSLLDSGHNVAAVYTQPPRPKGRGHKMQKSPVHELAQAHDIPVEVPARLKGDAGALEQFKSYRGDIAVVAAYGLILPREILDTPPYGCLNIHASLLPRWRGASPVQQAILAGDERSGITIMQMDEGLDTGPALAEHIVPIDPGMTATALHDMLAAAGGDLITDVLDRIVAGESPEPRLQDDAAATYAPLLSREDGRIDWTRRAEEIERQVRALNPWPGVWCRDERGRRLKILDAKALDEALAFPPGHIMDMVGRVACGDDTALQILRVQPENAKAMDTSAAMNGQYLAEDMKLQ